MKIVVVVEDVMVETYDKWSKVEKEHPTLKRDEFTQHGEDWICAMDLDSYRVSRDVKVLENIATDKIFGKKQVDWLTTGATAIAAAIVMIILG